MVQAPFPNILKNITWLYVVEYKLYHVDLARGSFLQKSMNLSIEIEAQKL